MKKMLVVAGALAVITGVAACGHRVHSGFYEKF